MTGFLDIYKAGIFVLLKSAMQSNICFEPLAGHGNEIVRHRLPLPDIWFFLIVPLINRYALPIKTHLLAQFGIALQLEPLKM